MPSISTSMIARFAAFCHVCRRRALESLQLVNERTEFAKSG